MTTPSVPGARPTTQRTSRPQFDPTPITPDATTPPGSEPEPRIGGEPGALAPVDPTELAHSSDAPPPLAETESPIPGREANPYQPAPHPAPNPNPNPAPTPVDAPAPITPPGARTPAPSPTPAPNAADEVGSPTTEIKPTTERQLDDAVAESFPASDPTSTQREAPGAGEAPPDLRHRLPPQE